MVKIPPFAVEQWMDEYETTPGVLNIAETCCASISVNDLVGFHENNLTGSAPPPSLNLSTKLTYGAIRGSEALRRNITSLYQDDEGQNELRSEDVIVTQGAISANLLVFYGLVGPGDHVICVFPTYQQLYSVPESLGAEVSLWELKEEEGFLPNVETLKGLIRPNTKMIVINNPNNPTGITIPRSILTKIVNIAQQQGIILFADEVYRPLFHSLSEDEMPPSILSLGYKNSVVTSSMSKAWALAGIRVGWVASPNSAIIEELAKVRDYTTISVSQLDDQVASYALSSEVRPQLIARNLALARTNLALLEKFVGNYSDVVTWVRPNAGTTAFLKFCRLTANGELQPVDDERFCLDVLEKTKVMFLPGSKCFGHDAKFQGYVRIGYVSETEVLVEALAKLGDYIKRQLY